MHTNVLMKTASWETKYRGRMVYGSGSGYCIVRDCGDMNDHFWFSGDQGENMAAEASKQRLGVCN
jgi:hypothetical protein